MHEVVPLAGLEAAGANVVEQLLANAPAALAETKQLALESAFGGMATDDPAWGRLVRMHAAKRQTGEAAEGLASFVEGRSDSLAAEVAPLGIAVTCVAPGPFRTDWAGRSLRQTPSHIAAYADSAGARLKATAAGSGSQAGDPARAAEAMIRITQVDKPPRHLVLGAVGLDAVTGRLRASLAETEAWREVGTATDFPAC